MELYAGSSSAESRSRDRSASTGVAKVATANAIASPRNRFIICPLRFTRCRTTYGFIPVANQARGVRRRGGAPPKERARPTYRTAGGRVRRGGGGAGPLPFLGCVCPPPEWEGGPQPSPRA